MTRGGSREDLDRARELFASVVSEDENYAPGWSGLGITHLQYPRHGLGRPVHVLEPPRASHNTIALDPRPAQANLYRASTRPPPGATQAPPLPTANPLQPPP